jgi:hypothetical protein
VQFRTTSSTTTIKQLRGMLPNCEIRVEQLQGWRCLRPELYNLKSEA